MERILAIGDAVAPTGFSTVMHNILGNLDRNKFDVHHLGVNYFGDPHDYWWKIYPANIGGTRDIWGFSRIKNLAVLNPSIIFIINDPWVVSKYLKLIKEHSSESRVVVYFPVDAMDLDVGWFQDYDIVEKICVYTEFGKNEIIKILPPELRNRIAVIPHGIDKASFFKINNDRTQVKKSFFSDNEEFINSFVVLNANRNQPRKRVDLTIQGFSIFARDKPNNVKLYLHMGTKDAGFDILKLAVRYQIDTRLVLSNQNRVLQSVPITKLNYIYNACDVGLNTCLGEGWSLTNMEHAITGAPQIVPGHSALKELYNDCGLLIPINQYLTNQEMLTISGLVHPKDVAEKLNEIYENKELYADLADKTLVKFNSPIYEWKNIVKTYWNPIFEGTYA